MTETSKRGEEDTEVDVCSFWSDLRDTENRKT